MAGRSGRRTPYTPKRAAPHPTPTPRRPSAALADAPLRLRIHPSSALHRVRPDCVMFVRCQQSDDGWYEMQGVTAVTQAALAAAAPHYYQARR